MQYPPPDAARVAPAALAARAIVDPASLTGLDAAGWDLLVRQCRRAGLLGRLHGAIDASCGLDAVPAQPRRHLEAARLVSAKHAQVVRWEIRMLGEPLRAAGVPLVLLKGAAYLAAGLPPATGRVFSDIDILVPKASLREVEKQLLLHGWTGAKSDAYDQRYYREWMHELPPLRHRVRNTHLDVHHNLLPETSRYRLRAEPIHAATVAIDGREDLRVLAPADMVLHSAAHLFCDGEFERGLRDLADIDDLLRHFGTGPGFWDDLVRRADELGLTRPLHYALAHRARVLGAVTPPGVVRALEPHRPGTMTARTMDALLGRALRPAHPSCDDSGTALARWLLYVRGHYLRMPMHRLIPHLARKALRREEP